MRLKCVFDAQCSCKDLLRITCLFQRHLNALSAALLGSGLMFGQSPSQRDKYSTYLQTLTATALHKIPLIVAI